MRKRGILIDFIGFSLLGVIVPGLVISGYWGLGTMLTIVGVFLLNFNRQ